MSEKAVGQITHWYDKIGVAVIKLSGTLKTGDRIVIRRDDQELEDSVASMQVDHQAVTSSKAGEEVAVKLSVKTKEGAMLYLAD